MQLQKMTHIKAWQLIGGIRETFSFDLTGGLITGAQLLLVLHTSLLI